MRDAASQRALRKQLLLMRSATERAELVQAVMTTRQSASFFKSSIPRMAMGGGLPLALGLLKRAPLLSPLLSLLMTVARKPLLRYGLLAAGSALLVWKGYHWLAARPAQGGPLPEDDDPLADA